MNNDLMIKNLNTLKLKLNKDNQKIFDDIIIYLRTSNLTEDDTEAILQEQLDLFLHPENISKPISEIIGTTNYKDYFDSIIKESKSTTLNFIKETIIPVMLYGFIFLNFYEVILDIIFDVFIKKIGFNLTNHKFKMKDLVSLIIFIPGVFMFFKIMSNDTFKIKNTKNTIKQFLMLYLVILIIIGSQVILGVFFKDFTSMVLFTIPSIFVLIAGVITIIFLVIKLLKC